MKISKIHLKLAALALIIAFGTSCTTTYDAYGRPRQSVDPGLAVAGIAAAGLVGYAIANDNDKDHRHYRKRYHSNRYSRNHRYHGYNSHYGYNSYRTNRCY